MFHMNLAKLSNYTIFSSCFFQCLNISTIFFKTVKFQINIGKGIKDLRKICSYSFVQCKMNALLVISNLLLFALALVNCHSSFAGGKNVK